MNNEQREMKRNISILIAAAEKAGELSGNTTEDNASSDLEPAKKKAKVITNRTNSALTRQKRGKKE